MSGGRLGVGNDPRYQHKQTFNPFPFPAPDGPEKERIRQLAEDLDTHRKSRQALHPNLTMTGMYNVLEQLRRGEPMGPKDRLIHEQGLVSVLRQIHDELDAAVLAAYGWEDLVPPLLAGAAGAGARTLPGPLTAGDVANPGPSDRAPDQEAISEDAVEEIILQRLVALNAERAAEEGRGLVRWLRPDFQNPGHAGPGEAQAAAPPTTTPTASGSKPDWPKTLPEQFQALRTALAARPGPAGAADLAQGFTRAPRARVAELLDTLTSLGHARRLDDGRYLPG